MQTIKKPTVYIASAYTKGDVAINVHFQCQVFDELLSSGKVLPISPLWSHFQHLLFPREYKDWIAYDQEMLKIYDCCLRLEVKNQNLNYQQYESDGASAEVETFNSLNKPVFYSLEELYKWVEEINNNEK